MSQLQTSVRMAITGCAAVLLSTSMAVAPAVAQTTAPDNSGVNKTQHKTADGQSQSTTDREMTAKIRRAIVADKSLSMYAHNIKIITQNGAVTLKGPVKSDEEKTTVASKATEVAGQDKVTNQITVKQ